MEITSIDCRDYKAEQVIALLFDIHRIGIVLKNI